MTAPNTPVIRILLVDSQALLRAGLRLILEKEPGFTVVGEASGPEEALEGAHLQPDIILFNLNSGSESHLNLLPDLLIIAEGARILVLIDNFDLEVHQRVVCLGAKGLVQKTEPPDLLTTAVRKVYAGEVWLDPKTVSHVLDDLLYRRGAKQTNRVLSNSVRITRRERDIIALIGEGLKNRQIAERLTISEPTVRHYLTSIFEKVGVTDRLGLIIYAYQRGFANPPAVINQPQDRNERNGHKKKALGSMDLRTEK